jgi:ABC-type multidrug transport system fused ATPase/permease subunit
VAVVCRWAETTPANLLFAILEYRDAGRDLRSYRQDDVRQLISLVSQDTYLFNATVRENLLIARPDATEDDLTQAARQAQIHDFIQSLPEGYDTWIGERGLRLSGGERQRLAIARALLKDAPLLILDEPTANLDTLTERQLLDVLYPLMVARTTLVITHRYRPEAMDEILVPERGR